MPALLGGKQEGMGEGGVLFGWVQGVVTSFMCILIILCASLIFLYDLKTTCCCMAT